MPSLQSDWRSAGAHDHMVAQITPGIITNAATGVHIGWIILHCGRCIMCPGSPRDDRDDSTVIENLPPDT